MNTTRIKQLRNQAVKEAQIEVDRIFKKYSELICNEIAAQIPKGQTLLSGNGLCQIVDRDKNEIRNNSIRSKMYDKEMNYLAELQYSTDSSELSGTVTIRQIIAGKKK